MTIDGEFGDFLQRIASIPDLDGGGQSDLLIGSMSALGTRGLVRIVSSETGLTIFENVGSATNNDALGATIATLGDFDGDSICDYAAGAPGAHPNGNDSGLIRVFSGATGQKIVDIPGPYAGFEFGRFSLAGIGDVNGDGYADLAAGGFDDHVRVHLGPNGALLRIHPGQFTRPSVAGIGDVDGDRVPDYAVGWPQDGTNGCLTGKVVVYSGTDGSLIYEVYGSTPCTANYDGDHLGRSLSAAGDVDGDGFGDFVAGAPGGLGLQFGAGEGFVRLYSGHTGAIIHEVTADTPGTNDAFGFRVSGGSDVNRDGVPDFMVGAHADIPEGGISEGWGSVSLFSGATGEMLWKQFGTWFSEPYGRGGVAVLDDLDGDGFAEFALTNDSASFSYQFAGRVIVFRGAPGEVTRYCTPSPNSTGSPAVIDTLGPVSVGNDRLDLVAEPLPAGQFGLFIYATDPAATPFGDGVLCVGGQIFRIGTPQAADSSGVLRSDLPFDEPPANAGSGAIVPGSTWYLQCWYRDPGGPGGNGFNLSDALEVLFTP